MIATSLPGLLCCGLLLAAAPAAQAALGEAESSVGLERMQLRARHQLRQTVQFSTHELTQDNGAVLRQYVNRQGRVFAVQWISPIMPDLASLLGAGHTDYRQASERLAQQVPGVQRHFRHSGSDLVVQSDAHLNIFRGHAYKPSLVPPGLSLQQLGLE